ncbi:MAG TPA: ZIP family metal transporter [Candidatus Thermoplasmatota archaeon]|nr:ZIP family metal transporter [Candidatus Thermoplasmatota archaeon]
MPPVARPSLATEPSGPAASEGSRSVFTLVALGLLPLLLLAAVLYGITLVGLPNATQVPVEDVWVERTVLAPGEIRLTIRNVGPQDVSISQVIVNDMLVPFAIGQEEPLGRLDSTTLAIPFDWVEGEPLAIALITSNAIKFEAEVAAAVPTPEVSTETLGLLALLGLYVGAIPVLLGLLWRPLLDRLSENKLNFFLGITVGLLLFLAAESLFEGFEIAEGIPAVLGGPFLLLAGAAGAFLLLEAASRWSHGSRSGPTPLVLAALVALGIGLHNFAEGLAIGGAFALGEVALGAFLVVGFAIHNTTEGLAIVAPVSRTRVGLLTLLGLGLLAGLPTVLGAWMGGLAPSAPLALIFLGVGAGAILQVALAIDRSTDRALRAGPGLVGVVLGALIMYATGLLVSL